MLRRIISGFIAGLALIAVAAIACVPLPALAQVAGADSSDVVLLSVAELILGALGTVALPTILAIWSLIKAHAAQTEAQWDDWVVARVEKVAREVVNQAALQGSVLPLSPEPSEPLDLRGRLGNGGAQ